MFTFAFVLIAIAATPFFLFPAIIALRNRKRRGRTIAALNVLLAVFLIISVMALQSDNPGFRIPLPGVVPLLIMWLALLHFSMKRDEPSTDDIDEAVELVPYDPAWPASFAREASRLAGTLALPEGALEHIGSTAVPGLAAKPVVDMMLGTPGFPPPADLLARLEILGYQNLGEAGVPNRVYLRRREGQSFNLHAMRRGGDLWADNLALRERLRRDPAARERYSAAKQNALQESGGRLLAYSAAKGGALDELLAAARKP